MILRKYAVILKVFIVFLFSVRASETYAEEIIYSFDNFESRKQGCFELKFKDISQNKERISILGRHRYGSANMYIQLKQLDNQDVKLVFKSDRMYLGNFDYEYIQGEDKYKINVTTNHEVGSCKFSFELANNNPTYPDISISANNNVETSSNKENTSEQDEIEKLKQQLAELQSKQSQTQQIASTNTQIPIISITRAETDNKTGLIVGRIRNDIVINKLLVDGNIVSINSNGDFEYSTYVPVTGKTVEVQVTDLAGLTSSVSVILERNVNLATASISFKELNPIAKPAKRNSNALALIIGVSDYRNTPAKAIFADADAMMFHDYASEKLGIPENQIKTLVNDGADIREFLLSTQNWLSRSVKQDQTDVYVFFAGHGLASDDGQNMYLLPYDGSPELLDRTAILRDELFSDIASANPRSVTVFLDTCYSGSTRGSEMLIAARPILLKAKESAVPEGFTVFTAAAGDETAKPLEEAKHGMFSYFLMKGMEGDADTNGDKQITAGELHAYVKSNVIQQSNGTQTPELQGDENRVLVRFQ